MAQQNNSNNNRKRCKKSCEELNVSVSGDQFHQCWDFLVLDNALYISGQGFVFDNIA